MAATCKLTADSISNASNLTTRMNNLIGTAPAAVLPHGPKKLYLNSYLWHSPAVGIVASYSPTAADVEDHFGLFRGVDQVEAFAQATIVSCSAFSECIKQQLSYDELKATFYPLFLSIGQVKFHNILREGDVFVSLGYIKFYKFRQMACDGRIYKVPPELDINEYFSHFTEQRLLNYELRDDFVLVAELFDITGKGLKKSKTTPQ